MCFKNLDETFTTFLNSSQISLIEKRTVGETLKHIMDDTEEDYMSDSFINIG